MFVRNCWYVAAGGDEVGREPLARTILGEPVALYRTQAGAPVALEDRCVHRSLPLSQGSVVGDTLQCGYHGLRFDDSGACVGVPGQSSVPPGARIRAYPVADRYHWLWIWMGDPAAADESLIIDFPWFEAPGREARGWRFHARCNYALLVDNLMNFTHLTYVHGTTIGNDAVTGEAEVTTERNGDRVLVSRLMKDVAPPPTYAKAGDIAVNVDRGQYIEFIPPSFVHVNATIRPLQTNARALDRHSLHAITPETQSSTHYFWATAHELDAYGPDVMAELHEQFRIAFTEDLGILEAQQANIERNPDAPSIDTNADAGGLEVRRIIDRLTAAEGAPQLPR